MSEGPCVQTPRFDFYPKLTAFSARITPARKIEKTKASSRNLKALVRANNPEIQKSLAKRRKEPKKEIELAVKIRLSRHGAKKRPYYRVVVADERMPRDGRYIEQVGVYNPLTQPHVIELDLEKINAWIGKGAKPSDTVGHLIQILKDGHQPAPAKKEKKSKKQIEKARIAAEEAAAAKEAAEAEAAAEKEAAEAAAAEEAAAEAAPAEEAPLEAPAEEKSAEAPAEEKPAEEAKKEEAPAEEKPAEEAPAEDKPANAPAAEKPAE